MTDLMTIGEFARVTQLSVKALRHYDELGLLPPAEVDRSSGYRRYAVVQVPTAQAIRRFRDLDLPLDQIRALLGAGDRSERERVLTDHLDAVHAEIERSQAAVQALQELLAPVPWRTDVEHRSLPETTVLGIAADVGWDDAEAWLDEAFAELADAMARASAVPQGPAGALYDAAFFERHEGRVLAFVPTAADLPRLGRAGSHRLEAREVAVMVHRGPFATLDETYASLGTYVVQGGIGADGPILENYVSSGDDDAGTIAVTEVCWPITADGASG